MHMFKKQSVDTKSKSKSPKSQSKELKKNKTEKELKLKPDNSKKVIFGKSDLILSFKKPSLPQNPLKKPESPKWNSNFRKPLQKWSPNMKSENQFKKIQRQINLQKPKIMRGKNQSYNQLQEKLKTLQQKLESLRNNLIKQQKSQSKKKSIPQITAKGSKSKPKNKILKSKTESNNKKIIIFNQSSQEEKNQSFTIQQQVLNNYVTQVKPKVLTNPTKQHKHSVDQLNQSTLDQPYYTGLLIKNFKIKQEDNLARDHIILSLTTMNHLLKKLKKPEDSELSSQKIKIKTLKKNQKKKTIIFDLDQTLIHCNEVQAQCDIKLPILFPTGETIEASINIRPHAKEILQNLSKRFQILVFTASHSCYANVVLDYLDPHNKFITQRLYRDQCYQTEEGMYVKDLRVISNRQLQNMVLVDNAAYSYIFQLDNGIPIIPFYDSKVDVQLKILQKFLIQKIENCKDVREVLKNHFKLGKYHEFTNGDKLIEDLYIKNL